MSQVNLCLSLIDKSSKDIQSDCIFGTLIKFIFYFDLKKKNLVS